MSTEALPTDETHMRAALAEGAQGLGLTSPNPPVGAIVVREGEIVGRGWHRKAGQPHAEPEAITAARADHGPDVTEGATLYVTLEPCSTHGRTPPCTRAIIDAKFARVVVGTTDPNPAHAGAGLEILRAAGIEVVAEVCEKEAADLIRFFAKLITTGTPWVIAKSATTLDGKTTLPVGEGQWISSLESREDVQRWRRQCDAILVGGETFRIDNPSLTLRGEYAKDRPQPLRVVLTSDASLPRGHKLYTDEHSDRTRTHRGMTLQESLNSLGEEGVASVMLESGGRLLSHALAEGLVDEVILYLAPILGGGSSRLIHDESIVAQLSDVEVERIGPDIRVRGRIGR